MKLTTTLAKIRAHSPCPSGWKTLVTTLGGIEAYGEDTEINLLTILESNGVQDMLWCLRATNEDSKRVASELAMAFAEEVLPIFEKRRPNDYRPRLAIQAAKDFNAGKITREELMAKRRDADAAADAAYAAHAAAAYAAAAAAAAADADAAAAAAAAYAAAAADAYAAYAAAAADADAAAAAAAADAAYAAHAADADAAYAAHAAAAHAAAAAAAAADADADAREKMKARQAEIIRMILE